MFAVEAAAASSLAASNYCRAPRLRTPSAKCFPRRSQRCATRTTLPRSTPLAGTQVETDKQLLAAKLPYSSRIAAYKRGRHRLRWPVAFARVQGVEPMSTGWLNQLGNSAG